MIQHPAYNHRSTFCRMQHLGFRHFYIDPIPNNSTLPYDIERRPQGITDEIVPALSTALKKVYLKLLAQVGIYKLPFFFNN